MWLLRVSRVIAINDNTSESKIYALGLKPI